MRGCLILSVLALAGCGEHLGWNPNYNFAATRYGEYRTTREAALVTGAESPRTIPVARPFYAPTAAQIAGRDPVPVPPTMGVGQARILRPLPVAPARPTAARPTGTVPIVIVPPSMRTGDQPPL